MRLRAIVLCLVMLLGSGLARADSIAAPTSYRMDVSDSLEFIMLAQGDWGGEEDRLRREYPATGRGWLAGCSLRLPWQLAGPSAGGPVVRQQPRPIDSC